MIKTSISYARANSDIMRKLEQAFEPLEASGLIELWIDKRMKHGAIIKDEIRTAISRADLILILASNDYFLSPYCMDDEIGLARRAREERGALLIPIIVGDCPWRTTYLGKFKALPEDGKPLLDQPAPDATLAEIVATIEERVKEYRGSWATSPDATVASSPYRSRPDQSRRPGSRLASRGKDRRVQWIAMGMGIGATTTRAMADDGTNKDKRARNPDDVESDGAYAEAESERRSLHSTYRGLTDADADGDDALTEYDEDDNDSVA